MKEEYEDLTAYLLDLLKEGRWNGQLYKLDYNKKQREKDEKRNE